MTAEPHSAAYFGAGRDFWWNHDYLELLARRWRVEEVRDVLDLGSGVGHWGRLVAAVLPDDARVTGVDREPAWVAKATANAESAGLADRFTYLQGVAERLPFPDGSFDMATCQTVLIHVADPAAVVGELLRVLRPGGLLVLAEPSNRMSFVSGDTVLDARPTAQLAEAYAFYVTCERGKVALGEGDNSVGDLLPGIVAAHGVDELQVSLNDRAHPIVPPYDSAAELAEVADQEERGEFWIWDRAMTERYFLAGGGVAEDFAGAWERRIAEQAESDAARDAGTLHSGGASVSYVVSARKRSR